jgi:hypothetical protein
MSFECKFLITNVLHSKQVESKSVLIRFRLVTIAQNVLITS